MFIENIKRKKIVWLIFIGLIIGEWDLSLGKDIKEQAKTVFLYQLSYFQKLDSLEYTSTLTMQDAELADIPYSDVFFVLKGDKYYRKVVMKGTKGEEKGLMINSFNGESYQYLYKMGIEQKGILIFSSNPLRDDTASYDVLLELYSFVYAPNEIPRFATLKEKTTWERLVDGVAAYSEAEMFGHKGVKLTLQKPKVKIGEGDAAYYQGETYEVFFASEFTYFPLYIYRRIQVSPIGESQWAPTEISEELKVTEVKSIESTVFPLKIERISKDKNGELIGKTIFKIDTKSLKINKSVDEKVFTIPRTGVGMIVNEDTGEVIRE
ncbi:hypothetical protein H5T87_01280 [bacterium]|nr:hypothetical protein [bacterium]